METLDPTELLMEDQAWLPSSHHFEIFPSIGLYGWGYKIMEVY